MITGDPGSTWPTEVPGIPRGSAVVVEDHLILRTTLVSLLEGLGYAVRSASNGFSGLRLIRQLEPDFVVLDVVMPELDGQQVLEAMRDDPSTAEIPTLVVTGFPGGIPGAGARDRLLPKPFAYEEFIAAVEALAPVGAPPSRALASVGV